MGEEKLSEKINLDAPQIPPIEHHGGAAEYYAQHCAGDKKLLDFSANISPFGMPDHVKQAIITSLDDACSYPDPENRELCSAIACKFDVPSQYVCATNGASDALYRIAAACAPGDVVVFQPTFSEYARAFKMAGHSVINAKLCTDHEWKLPHDIDQIVVPGVSAVCVCQPNNPTGSVFAKRTLERLLSRCEQVGARLIVDECFVGFLDDPKGASVSHLVDTHPALAVVSAFTKLFGMAGIRLGFTLCSDQNFCALIRAQGQPWAVSSIAQVAGIAACQSDEYMAKVRVLVSAERERVRNALQARGIDAHGHANFLFFQLDDDGNLARKLIAKGILIRDCANFYGLAPGAYRIAVLTKEKNNALLRAIDDIYAGTRGDCV